MNTPQPVGFVTLAARQPHQLRRVIAPLATLCRVRHGRKRLVIGTRTMEAGADSLVLLPAGLALDLANLPGPDGYRVDVVTVPADLVAAARGRTASPAGADPLALCVPLQPALQLAWDHLLALLAADAAAELCRHAADGVLLALQLQGAAVPLLLDSRGPLAPRIARLLAQDPAADWSAARIAGQLGLSPSTLRRRLKEEHSSWRALLQEARLGQALAWLQATRRPIAEIAAGCGYSSASRFAIRFRARYGLSPAALRRAL